MTLFTVGPVEMSPDVRSTGAIHLPYFRTRSFSSMMLALEEELLGLFGAPAGSRALFLSGSGTSGMEAAVAGLFDAESDRLLIVNGGSFGQRFVEIAARHRIPHQVLTVPFEADLTPELFAEFADYAATGLLINQGETSVGKLYDLKPAADYCRRTGALLVVDAVSSFLNDPLNMEAQAVDCALTASQKALALPPGLAPLVLGPRALAKAKDTRQPLYYLDLQAALRNQERGQTPWTPALAILYQLETRLAGIRERGGLRTELEQRRGLAAWFRAELKRRLPAFRIPAFRKSNGLTPLLTEPYDARALFESLEEEGLIITPSGGDWTHRLTRIGHMGYLRPMHYEPLLDALVAWTEKEKR
ncbi:MAG: aminotransferase class V-fold PLP-dependent enzyme [Bacillota bacterium]|nr:aminotransferase class V-fold PLP-dependent enzyme [Bacillota bacterium]